MIGVIGNKNSIWRSVLIALGLLSLMACGKKPHTSSSEDVYNSKKRRPLVDNSFESYAKKQKLDCVEGECPSYLVQVLIKDDLKSEVVSCTGFLIDESHILTSAQCIPENLSQDDIDCSSNIYTIFQEGKGVAPIECDKVEKIAFIAHQSELATWPNDYAILKLMHKADTIKPVQLSTNGLSEAEKVSLWGVETRSEERSVIKKTECEVVWNSYAQPFATSSKSPNMTVAGCEVPDTFKGAPLISQSDAKELDIGHAVAIYSGKVSRELLDEIPSTILNDDPASMAYISNIACMKLKMGQILHSDCSISMGYSELANARGELLNSFTELSVIKNFIRGQLFDQDSMLRWEAKYEFDDELYTYRITPEPTCFHNVKDWIDDFRDRKLWKKAGFISNWPKWQIKTSLDSYLKVSLYLDQSPEEVKYDLEFSPKKLWKDRSTYLNIDVSDESLDLPNYELFGECE